MATPAQVDIEIYRPFGPPASPAISLSLIGATEWQAAASSLNFMLLDLAKQASNTAQALIPLWGFGNDDTTLLSWTPVVSAWERDKIQDVYLQHYTEIARLLGVTPTEDQTTVVNVGMAIQQLLVGVRSADDFSLLWPFYAQMFNVSTSSTISTANQQKLWELAQALQHITTYGFWEEKVNLFGDGCTGLYRSCSHPAVPWKIRSNRPLDPDRPFTVWLHRAMSDEKEEINPLVRIQFGDYALEFSQNSQVTFYKYNPQLTFAEREQLQDQLDQLDRGGRQAAELRETIAASREEIETITQTARQAKRRASAAEQAQRKALRQRVTDAKEDERDLKRDAELEAEEIKQQLYLSESRVSFSESQQNYHGVDIPVTFISHRKGYISIHIGRPGSSNYWVFEDKEKRQVAQWSSMWKANQPNGRQLATPLTISSTGGSAWFRTSYVIPARNSRLVSRTLRTERDLSGLSGDDLFLTVSWDAAPAEFDPVAQDWIAPQADVVATLEPLDTDGRFRWILTVENSSEYLPIIYRAELNLLAEARDREAETLLWSSWRQAEDPNYVDPIESANPKIPESRSEAVGYEITLIDLDGSISAQLQWPHNHQIRVYRRDTRELLYTGVITKYAEKTIHGGARRLTMDTLDRMVLLSRDRVEAETSGSGLSVGQYILLQHLEAGFAPDEVVIEDCDVTQQVISHPAPGEDPPLRPEYGTTRLEFLHEILEFLAFGFVHYMDASGRSVWESDDTITQTAYTLQPTHQTPTDRMVYWDAELAFDFDDFYNDFTVVGAVRPGGTDRFTARYVDHTSIHDPSSWTYVGTRIPAEVIKSDAIRSDAAAVRAVRHAAQMHGFPKVVVTCTTHYHTWIRPGLRFWIYVRNRQNELVKVACKVEAIKSVNQSEDKMDLSLRILAPAQLRFATS